MQAWQGPIFREANELSARLRLTDAQAVFRLVSQLCERGDRPRDWLTYLLEQLCPLLEATFAATGFEAGADVKVPRASKRSLFYCIHCGPQPRIRRTSAKMVEQWRASSKMKSSRDSTNHHIDSSLHLSTMGITHRIFLCRNKHLSPFPPRAASMVRLLHEELAHVWQRDRPRELLNLPPRLKQSLTLLLQGHSEKQIAAAMGLSRHSVHDHVKRLHRHFRVSSRAELLALCRPTDRFVPTLLLPLRRGERQNQAKE